MRILGIFIPDNKRILISLTNIYGIGLSRSRLICKLSKVAFSKKTLNLNDYEISNISNHVKKFLIEGDLKREVNFNIKKLIDSKCYRGIRHLKKLPLRGQRTRTNARTRRGPRKLMFKK